MCKLIVGIKNNNENEEFANAIYLQESELRKEKDGISGLIMLHDGTVKIWRNFFNYDEVFRNVYEHLNVAKLVVLHARTGTSGEKSLTNVHLFNYHDWVFAHNGFVGAYGWYYTKYNEDIYDSNCKGCMQSNLGTCKKHRVKTNAKCDSFQFLEALVKETNEDINVHAILNKVNSKQFTGVGFLMNTTTKEAFLFNDNKKIHVLTDNQSYSIFHSYEPEMKMKIPEIKTFAGVRISIGSKEIELNSDYYEAIDGVYKLELDTPC